MMADNTFEQDILIKSLLIQFLKLIAKIKEESRIV